MMHTQNFALALALGALLAVGPPAARAQGPGIPPPPGGPGMMQGRPWGGPHGGPGMMQRLSQALNLTPTQQAKLAPIFQAQRSQMMSLFGNTSLTQPQKFQRMQAMRRATDARIAAVLTPAQRAKWTALRAQMRMQRHGPGG